MSKYNNRALAWKIFEALKANGAGIGSASVNIIEDVLDNAQQSFAPDAASAPRIVEVLDENGNPQKIAVV